MSNETLALSLFVHLTATAVWIGGLLVTMLLVWPAVRRKLEDTPQIYGLLSMLRKRFFPISNLSLAALVTTGMFQMAADPNYDGLLNFDNVWSQVMLVKHVVIALMVVAGLLLQYGIVPALERASILLEKGKGRDETPEEWQRLRQREVWLTWANGLLGLSVLGLSAWLGVL